MPRGWRWWAGQVAVVAVVAVLAGCAAADRTDGPRHFGRSTTTSTVEHVPTTTADPEIGLVTGPGSSAATITVVSPARLSIEVPRNWFLAGSKYGGECDAPVAPSLVVQDVTGPELDLGGDCVVGTDPKHPALAVVFGSRRVPSEPIPDAPGRPATFAGLRAMVHGPVRSRSGPAIRTELVNLPDRDAWLMIQGYDMSAARFDREVRSLLGTLRSTGPSLRSRVPAADPEKFVDSYGAHDEFLRISSPTSAYRWFGGGAPWDTQCLDLEPIDGGTRLLATVVSATWFDTDGKEHLGQDPTQDPVIGTQEIIEIVDHDLIATYTAHDEDAGTQNVYMYREDDWAPKSIAPCADPPPH